MNMVGINFPDWGCRIPVLSLSVWPRLTLPLKHDCCPTLPSIAHTSFHRVFFLGVSGIPSIPLWVVFFRRFLPRTLSIYVILKSNVKLFWHRNCRRRHSFNLSLHQNWFFLHQKFFFHVKHRIDWHSGAAWNIFDGATPSFYTQPNFFHQICFRPAPSSPLTSSVHTRVLFQLYFCT